MELGIKTATHHIEWATMKRIWQFADESGVYAQGWNFDHFYPIVGDTNGPCLEAWITLTALAQHTHRIRIGTMVNGIVYRHPAVVAAMASSLDIVSSGRLELGLGAGWNDEECDAYGIALGSLSERFDRFDEAAQIILALLHTEEVTFNGQFFQLKNARNEPKGLQQPLPICIGGLGEKRTLRAVAAFADHWNLPGFSEDLFAHKRRVLAEHCEAVDRDISDIKTSAHVVVDGYRSDRELLAEVTTLKKAGIDQAIIYFQPPVGLAFVEAVTFDLASEFGFSVD